MMDFWKYSVLLPLIILLSGCSGGGCQSDSQCKHGESCVNGICSKGCFGEYEWCESSEDCCVGMECTSNACRSPKANLTDRNKTGESKLNETLNSSYAPFAIRVFDLAEGQEASIGEILLKVSEVSENLIGCSVENESVRLKITLRNQSEEFGLRTGESINIANANIKVLNIPCTVSENETTCNLSSQVSEFELEKKDSVEAVLGRGDRLILPDGVSFIEIQAVEDRGKLNGYWRSFELAEGESISEIYSSSGTLGRIELKIEEITEVSAPVPAGNECRNSSKRVRIKIKLAGMPEFYVVAGEGETADARIHRIKVEKIIGEFLPSDGKGCSAFNKKVLLNISFPEANSDILVSMNLYSGDMVSEISANARAPWVGEGLKLETSYIRQGSDQKIGNAFLRATATKRKKVSLLPGGSANLGSLSLKLESISPKIINSGKSCHLVDLKANVIAAKDDQSVKRELAIGDVVSFQDDSSIRFLDSQREISRRVGSCYVVLERAVIAVTPLNSSDGAKN